MWRPRWSCRSPAAAHPRRTPRFPAPRWPGRCARGARRPARGDRQPRPQRLLIEIELGGLAGGQERPDRLPRQLQHHLARHRRREFHRQDAVFELHRVQFGGGVDDVLGARRSRAVPAQSAGRRWRHSPAATANRRRHLHPGNTRVRPATGSKTRRSPSNGCALLFGDADGRGGRRDQLHRAHASGNLPDRRFGRRGRPQCRKKRRPVPAAGRHRGAAPRRRALLAVQGNRARAQQRVTRRPPSPRGRARPPRSPTAAPRARVAMARRLCASAAGSVAERPSPARAAPARRWPGDLPFHEGDRAAVAHGLRCQQLLECLQPGALRARRRARPASRC